MDDLLVEQAVAREALRLAFIHHQQLATGLKGVQQQREISAALSRRSGPSLVNMFDLGLIIGSGGVLSHAPRRHQSALMMIDAFHPARHHHAGGGLHLHDAATGRALTRSSGDRHPGLQSRLPDPARAGGRAAGAGERRQEVMTVTLKVGAGDARKSTVYGGQLLRLPLATGEKARLIVRPAKGLDMGDGKGKPVEQIVEGGVVGVILDGRGRPLQLPEDNAARNVKLLEWLLAIGAMDAGAEAPVKQSA